MGRRIWPIFSSVIQGLIAIAAHRGTRSIIDVAASSDLAQLYFNGQDRFWLDFDR